MPNIQAVAVRQCDLSKEFHRHNIKKSMKKVINNEEEEK